MVRNKSTDTTDKPMRKPRKPRTSSKPKESARSAQKQGKRRVASAPAEKPSRFGWKETPRWLIWTVTAILGIAYICFMYVYYLKPYFYRWDFGDTYVGSPVVHGIDVSHHQGDIDWKRLARAEHTGSGIHFVFMKATEGSDWADSAFQYNFAQARANGFIRGAYHFFSNTSPAEEQARFFCSRVQLDANDLPPVLDVETRGNYGLDSLQLEVKTWLRHVERHYGVKPILYTSRRFKERYLNDDTLNAYPFWIAHYYVDSLTYQGPWTFWQHTDRGRLPGIRGRVDMNVFNGDLDSLRRFTIRPDDNGGTHADE